MLGYKLQLMAMARCFSFWWLVLPSREINNFMVKLQTLSSPFTVPVYKEDKLVLLI